MATMREQRIARELRTLRGSRNSGDVQRALGITPSKLSRIESVAVRPQPDDVRRLATFYGADVATIERLTEAAEEARHPAWWTQYVGPDWDAALVHHLELESEADRIESWTIDLVPGLLQVPNYFRALAEGRPDVGSDETDRRLELRALRQERIGHGLELWTIVGEAVLHQKIGGPHVLAEQLQHLHAPPRGVTVQVLPFEAGAHWGLGTSFHILHFAHWPAVIYQDTIKKGLYQDDVEVVQGHRETINHVRAAALDVRQSRSLLAQRIDQLEGEQ